MLLTFSVMSVQRKREKVYIVKSKAWFACSVESLTWLFMYCKIFSRFHMWKSCYDFMKSCVKWHACGNKVWFDTFFSPGPLFGYSHDTLVLETLHLGNYLYQFNSGFDTYVTMVHDILWNLFTSLLWDSSNFKYPTHYRCHRKNGIPEKFAPPCHFS